MAIYIWEVLVEMRSLQAEGKKSATAMQEVDLVGMCQGL